MREGIRHARSTFVKSRRGENTGHGVVLAHLLEDLNKEADLDLGCLLKQRIQSRSALGLAKNAKPLLNSAQLILEILIECGRSHFFQRRLVLINVRNPLLGDLVLRINVQAARAVTPLLRLAIEIG